MPPAGGFRPGMCAATSVETSSTMKTQSCAGFTMMEMMVVLIVAAVLWALAPLVLGLALALARVKDDPVLLAHKTRLIAEPWGAGGYHLGGFSASTKGGDGWGEWVAEVRTSAIM